MPITAKRQQACGQAQVAVCATASATTTSAVAEPRGGFVALLAGVILVPYGETDGALRTRRCRRPRRPDLAVPGCGQGAPPPTWYPRSSCRASHRPAGSTAPQGDDKGTSDATHSALHPRRSRPGHSAGGRTATGSGYERACLHPGCGAFGDGPFIAAGAGAGIRLTPHLGLDQPTSTPSTPVASISSSLASSRFMPPTDGFDELALIRFRGECGWSSSTRSSRCASVR